MCGCSLIIKMIIRILGTFDIFIGICFWLFGIFNLIPSRFIIILGLILLVKGIVFVWGFSLVSVLDIISAIMIIIAGGTGIVIKLVVILISLFLIQKGAFSILGQEEIKIVIEKVELSKERNKELDKEGKVKRERELYKKLVEDFNKEAVKINSSYRMEIETGMEYPKLISSTKGIFFNNTTEHADIFFMAKEEMYNEKDYFYFHNGLSYDVFRAIEKILNKLNFTFHIELISGDIPTKFKIIEELEN